MAIKPVLVKCFWYFVFPMALSGVLLAMYFSGNAVLENIIAAPDFEKVRLDSRREFGLVENLQNLFILGVIGAAIWAAIKQPSLLIKAFMVFVALGAFVLFLEEIDYGLHYYDLLAGVHPDDARETRNLHNQGELNTILKTASNAAMIAVFGVMPFAVRLLKIENKWVRYFTPDPFMALLLIVSLITRSIAHSLNNEGLGRGFYGMSEFREVVIYYLGFVYTLYLARRSPDALAETQASPQARSRNIAEHTPA